ncbi:MAG: hypothetical protein OXG34_11170 [bacterium]|nr:hypothetical protein [bacterium]MCY3890656.1 hypothetical protein [bacterium]MCY3962204.1 hypothetical protein [bacterium]MCY4135784.1 hypothetical protein [bacterium]
MTILLDTNILLRLVADSSRISKSFKAQVESVLGDGGVAVSSATFMEATRLHLQERIDLGCHPSVWRTALTPTGPAS